MLSISEFSEMCYLSSQTLRYYHSESLLVPADVDPQTGYRSYTFEQVEQAMLVTSLRALSRLTRHPLDDAYVDFSRMRQVVHDGGGPERR